MEWRLSELRIRNGEDFDVFKRAYVLSLTLHRASLGFPKAEQYGGLADQLRRASKSVCSLIVEGQGLAIGVSEGVFSLSRDGDRLGGRSEIVVSIRPRPRLRRGRTCRTMARRVRPHRPHVARFALDARARSIWSLITGNWSLSGSGAFRRLMKGQP